MSAPQNLKQDLRVFTTLNAAHNQDKTTSDINKALDHQQSTNKWGLFFAATHTLSLPIERLLLKTLNAELGVPGCIIDPYAAIFRSLLLPSWGHNFAVRIFARQYKNFVEKAVPGLLTYLDARTRWTDNYVQIAVQEGVQQVWFEVDAAAIMTKKRSLLSELPNIAQQRKGPALTLSPSPDQLTLVSLDWNNPSTLIPALTASGFQPTVKTLVIMEGLLPHLTQSQVDEILSDSAALCAPGSRLVWDFLHLDAFNGSNRLYTGFESLAKACANKGAPFKSGQLAGGLSNWTKATLKLHLRITETLSAQDIGNKLVRPIYGAVDAAKNEENEFWCSAVSCTAPAAGAPQSLPLPQFYSFCAAVKSVPRINLKELGSPVDSARRRAAENSQEVSQVFGGSQSRRAARGGGSGGLCAFGGSSLWKMIWGQDTSEEDEVALQDSPILTSPPPPPPPKQKPPLGASIASSRMPAAPPNLRIVDLNKQKSAEWSLAVARHMDAPPQSPLSSPALPVSTSSGLSSSSLEHAISLPTQPQSMKSSPSTRNEPSASAQPQSSSWWCWPTSNNQ